MAAGLLESEGVEAMVAADDAGGAYPPLQFIRGVRLLVAASNQLQRGKTYAQPCPRLVESGGRETWNRPRTPKWPDAMNGPASRPNRRPKRP